jgi:hypothetical protein
MVIQNIPKVSGVSNIMNMWNNDITCGLAVLSTADNAEGLIKKFVVLDQLKLYQILYKNRRRHLY